MTVAIEQTGVATLTSRWPLWGVAAGVTGAIATIFTVVTTSAKDADASVLPGLSRTTYHVGGALGYITVACLLVLAGCWRVGTCEHRETSPAVALVADAFTAAAAGLTLGYGWKLAMALYLPGGFNDHQLGTDAQFVYFVLNDFGAFLGWLPVVVAAGAVAWMGLRHGLVSRWLALVSLLPCLAVAFMSLGMTVAGFAGIVGPIWMVVAFAALALGRHRLTGRR